MNILSVESLRVTRDLFNVQERQPKLKQPTPSVKPTASFRAPLRFLPCPSNCRLRSRSSLSHCSASVYSVGLGPRSADVTPAVAPTSGHGVGSSKNVPRCMCATCVGNLFSPSKIWVASAKHGVQQVID